MKITQYKISAINLIRTLLLVSFTATPLLALANNLENSDNINYLDNEIIQTNSADTIQDNQLCFKNINNLSFDNVTSMVTGGNSAYKVNSRDNCIHVKINGTRHGSTEVVSWVKTQMSKDLYTSINMATYPAVSTFNASGTPNKLNFAIKGNLSFTYNKVQYTCYNIILAQGHSGAYNNWWGFANISWVADNTNFQNGSLRYPANGVFMMECNDEAMNKAYKFYPRFKKDTYVLTITTDPKYTLF